MNEQLDLTALRDAIAALGDGLEVVNNLDWFNAQSSKVKNTLIAGVIQNFEIVYELSIKMIRRRLSIGYFSADDVDQMEFRDLLRSAAETGLIIDAETWFQYRKMRNITAHTYDHEKAQLVYYKTIHFIGDASALLAALEARNV
jgi:hypothetical protein